MRDARSASRRFSNSCNSLLDDDDGDDDIVGTPVRSAIGDVVDTAVAVVVVVVVVVVVDDVDDVVGLSRCRSLRGRWCFDRFCFDLRFDFECFEPLSLLLIRSVVVAVAVNDVDTDSLVAAVSRD